MVSIVDSVTPINGVLVITGAFVPGIDIRKRLSLPTELVATLAR